MADIPDVDRSRIEVALAEFDDRLRETKPWFKWESRASQLYAIEHDGRRYPPKKIIELATGMPVGKFYGGRPANRYVEERGFKVVTLPRPDARSATSLEVRFRVGKVYDRWKEINEPFGGSRQSGISPSSRTASIFLFTGETGEQYGYRDDFDADGVFSYTGEGQVGDMEFTKGNLAILEHAKQGKALFLFKSLGKGKGQEYLGEFCYANHSFRDGPDRNGDQRRVIVFHLVPVESTTAPAIDDDAGEADEVLRKPLTLEEARRLAVEAFDAMEGGGGKVAKRAVFRRNERVRRYVLLRAEGMCEACGKEAPFVRHNGSPYLEPHHTTRVSDGGLDHPRYVAAVCPTCHREIHHGRDGERKNMMLQRYLESVEADVE